MKKIRKGKIIIEDGVNVWPHELYTAKALINIGYNIKFIPKYSITSADAYINNTIFEFKAPKGSSVNSIERNIRKAIHHQSANIVIDSFRMKRVHDKSIQNFLLDRLRRGHGIKKILFITRDRKVVDINQLLR